jgi:hypothetical protein
LIRVRPVGQRERLADAKRAAAFTFESDPAVHIPRERAAERVVAEPGLVPVAGLGEEHAAARERPDLDTSCAKASFLRKCACGSKHGDRERG